MRCNNEDCRDAVAALRKCDGFLFRLPNGTNVERIELLNKVRAVLARIDANSDEEDA